MLKDFDFFLQQVKLKLTKNGEAWLSFQWNKGDDHNPLGYQGMRHVTIEEVFIYYSLY